MSSNLVDVNVLRAFEDSFIPADPEHSPIPARILGYGEISTVMAIQHPTFEGLACKRMPMFESEEEVQTYLVTYRSYVHALEKRVGIALVPGDVVWLQNRRTNRWVVYILQQVVASEDLGHKAIHTMSNREVERLVRAALEATGRVFVFNRTYHGEYELGFDGQISNWALREQGEATGKGAGIGLAYFDTSTPLMRVGGVERLNPELFLRSAPSFLVWILRGLFLEDIMTRYYDLRKVCIDLAANFYKEGRADLVPRTIRVINRYLADSEFSQEIEPIQEAQVRAYYREDAWIWRLYLAFRKVDRRLHQIQGRDYPYVLPGRVRR